MCEVLSLKRFDLKLFATPSKMTSLSKQSESCVTEVVNYAGSPTADFGGSLRAQFLQPGFITLGVNHLHLKSMDCNKGSTYFGIVIVLICNSFYFIMRASEDHDADVIENRKLSRPM